MQWGSWVSDRKLSWAAAGRLIGVSTSEARHFALGRIPRRPTMQRVYLATGGQVTPNDFYDLPDLPASDIGEAA